MINIGYLAAGFCLIFLQAVDANAAPTCYEALVAIKTQKYLGISEWRAIERHLGRFKSLSEISGADIGIFAPVSENLLRQQRFLILTLEAAGKKKVSVGRLQEILVRISKAIKTKEITYGEYWLLHLAMQEVADFHFSLMTEGSAKLDDASIEYVTQRMKENNFLLGQAHNIGNEENRIQKSLRLMLQYSDFDNARFSELKKIKVLGDERIPFPFFQRGFDIIEINKLARNTRIRPVEIMSAIEQINEDGSKLLLTPMIDNRPMAVGKDASDHDFNHLGFEVNAKATRELGRIMFEGSESLSMESQVVLNVIYFRAWHEWGVNLSALEPSARWERLLNPSSLLADMTNPNYLGGDPNVVKSIGAIDSTIGFLKKKTLPQFWE
jgi:hypothetical protein